MTRKAQSRDTPGGALYQRTLHGPLLLKSSRVAGGFEGGGVHFGGGWLGIARQPFVDVSYCRPRHRTSPHVTLAFCRRAALSYERLCLGLVIRVDLLWTFHTFARVFGLALLLVLAFASTLGDHANSLLDHPLHRTLEFVYILRTAMANRCTFLPSRLAGQPRDIIDGVRGQQE